MKTDCCACTKRYVSRLSVPLICQLGREKIDYEWNKINKLAFVTKVILKAEVWLPFMMFPMVKTIYSWQNKYE